MRPKLLPYMYVSNMLWMQRRSHVWCYKNM